MLKEIRKELKLFLSSIAKMVSLNHYSTIVHNSTSLQLFYNKLREDYDIQMRGIHFLNILDLNYNEEKIRPMYFYNHYRLVVMNNLGNTGEKSKDKAALQNDEILGPAFEDMIVVEVLRLIDPKLPKHIKKVYTHKITNKQRITHFKSVVFTNLNIFKEDMENKEQRATIKTDGSSLGAFQANKGSGYNRGPSRGSYGRGATRGSSGQGANRGRGSYGQSTGRGGYGQGGNRGNFTQKQDKRD